MRDFRDEFVLIVGAARQGIALARYILDHGGRVRLTDMQPASKMEPAMQALSAYSQSARLEWVLGEHPLSLLEGITLLCPSGGVPLEIPLIQEACQRGILLSNDSQIFLESAPCKTIGITGSAGKTTTTVLVGRILQFWKEINEQNRVSRVWVGGNIGSPLITQVDEMKLDDFAVMELSSFQLELMSRSPNLSCLLNITPNHLDRHKDFEAYTQAKLRILDNQEPDQIAVLGRDDPVAWSHREAVKGLRFSFGLSQLPDGESGSYLKDGWIWFRSADPSDDTHTERQLVEVQDISLRGQHNLLNVMAAATISASLGATNGSIQAGIKGFGGVPHRLEFIRSWGGADWYNDSIATAPERAIASILSFEEPIILISGGRDKHLPWEKFVECTRGRVEHLFLFGEASGLIQEAFKRIPGKNPEIVVCQGLKSAVAAASQVARPGSVVLLAPGGTSFDEFNDFEERGRCFAQWVRELP